MTIYQALCLMFLTGTFLLELINLVIIIVKNTKK